MTLTEINIQRLLSRCDLLINEKPENYKSSLESNLKTLQMLFNQLDSTAKSKYREKISILETSLNTKTLLSDKEPKGTIAEKANYFSMKREIEKDLKSKLISQPQTSVTKRNVAKEEEEQVSKHIELENEMLDSVKRLKESSLAFGHFVQTEKELVDSTQRMAESNLQKTQAERRKLNEFSEKSWKSTWFMWTVIVVVILLSIGIFLFMKVFSKRNKANMH